MSLWANFFKGKKHEGRPIRQGEFFVPTAGNDVKSIPNTTRAFNSSNVIFNQIFKSAKIHWKETDLISEDEVLNWMIQMSEPLWGEFVEESDNEEFLDISEEFFKYLFFNGKVWIWYGAIGGLPIDQEDKEPLQELEPGRDEFLLLIKMVPEDLRDNKYMDVKTGKLIFMPVEAEPIMVKWRGEDNIALPLWFSTVWTWLVGQKIYENKRLLFCKTFGYSKMDSESHTQTLTTLNNFSNLDPYIIQDLNMGKISELAFVEAIQLKEFLLAEYQRTDRYLAELGRVANINDKYERKTTGENYKDIHSVACRQRLVLNQLKSFAAKAQRRFGIELAFAVNGLLHKEPLQGDEEEHAGSQDPADKETSEFYH